MNNKLLKIFNLNQLFKNNIYSFFITLTFFIFIFYFLIIKPQIKIIKKHKEIINSINKGDEILTSSGLIGKVNKILKNEYILLSLNNSAEIIIKKNYIINILPKGTIKSIYK